MFDGILRNVHKNTFSPLYVTNYVTVNDVANALIACGSSPIMADDESDAVDITAICDALVINIGTLNERTIKAMLKTGRKANELSHPVVLDPLVQEHQNYAQIQHLNCWMRLNFLLSGEMFQK